MRTVLWAALVIATFASPVAAQSVAPAFIPQPVAESSHRGAYLGAGIGAGVGAGLGIALANGLCDGGHCYMSGYVKFALFTGSVGAAIGALIGAARDATKSGRAQSPSRGVVRITPAIGPRVRAGVVTIGF